MVHSNRERHGLSRTPEHMIWLQIKQRCTNPKNKRYVYYGAKGVTMHMPWQLSFTTFLEDVGNRPNTEARMTLDRIDGTKGYEPGNVRWVTWDIQSQNRSNVEKYTIGDRTLCLSQWSKITGVPRTLMWIRINSYGWTPEDAILKPKGSPTNRNRMLTFLGETLPMVDMARKHGISISLLKSRIRNGWDVETAITKPVAKKTRDAAHDRR